MPTLCVLRETRPAERRVALVPSELARLTDIDVVVESGAGDSAGFVDGAYEAAGGRVAPSRAQALDGAEIVAAVQPPLPEQAEGLPEGCTLVSFLPPAVNLDLVKVLISRRASAFSFDLVPRVSRAQSLDALSSQASLAGYQAAIVAAERLPRALPMMMTAAGTVPPAKVLIMGAGVAGLQAVATSRRLGASVSAYDVRREAADEVRSLGATFVELPLEAQTGQGGYAAEQSAEFLQRQQELVGKVVAASDIVITTAAVPGRPAPRLLSAQMVESMRPGSVVLDMSTASGGNVEVSRDGEELLHSGVLVIGASDLASRVAATASSLFARNVSSLLELLVRDGKLAPDLDDEVVASTCLLDAGVVRHEPTKNALEAANR